MTAPAATPPKRRREWFIAAGLLVIGLGIGLVLSGLVDRDPSPAAPLSEGLKDDMRSTESLQAVAEFFNRDLPRKVSADVQLDRVSAEPSGLVMSYTLLERDAANTSAAEVEQAFREKLTASYCREDASRLIRDAGISVAHRYAGSDGSDITEILVTPESCGGSHKTEREKL